MSEGSLLSEAPAGQIKPKPLQKFLKRGEGTQKRIFGPQLLKSKQQASSDVGHPKPRTYEQPSQPPFSAPAKILPAVQHPTFDELEELAELQAETTLVELEEAQRNNAENLASQPSSTGRGCHNPAAAPLPQWASSTMHLEDDYELDEFKALEQRIKKDVCGGAERTTVQQQEASFAPPKPQQPQPVHPRTASYTSSHWGDEDGDLADVNEEEKQYGHVAAAHQPPAGMAGLQRHPKAAAAHSGPATSTASTIGGAPAGAGAGFRGYSRGYANNHPGGRGVGSGRGASHLSVASVGGRGPGAAGTSAGALYASTASIGSGAGTGAIGLSSTGLGSNRMSGSHGLVGTAPSMALLQQQFGVVAPVHMGSGFEDDQWGEEEEEEEEEELEDGESPGYAHTIGMDGTYGQHKQSVSGDEDGGGGITQPIVRSLFQKQARPGSANKANTTGCPHSSRQASRSGSAAGLYPGGGYGGSVIPAEIERLQQQLLQETAKVQQEKCTLLRMRTELEKAANKLETERQAMERKQAEAASAFDTWRQAEVARLQRDRRVLEKQSKAILKLPSKKERGTNELLEAERKEASARDARHRLTVERLRRQVVELQEKCRELREEVRWHEATRLQDPQTWHASAVSTTSNALPQTSTTSGNSGSSGLRGVAASNGHRSGALIKAGGLAAQQQGFVRPGSACSNGVGSGMGGVPSASNARRPSGLAAASGFGPGASTSASTARSSAYNVTDGLAGEEEVQQQARRKGGGRAAAGSQGSSSMSFAVQGDEEVEDSSDSHHKQHPQDDDFDDVGSLSQLARDRDQHNRKQQPGKSGQQQGSASRQPREKCDLGSRMSEGTASHSWVPLPPPQQQPHLLVDGSTQQQQTAGTPNAWDVLFGSDGEEDEHAVQHADANVARAEAAGADAEQRPVAPSSGNATAEAQPTLHTASGHGLPARPTAARPPARTPSPHAVTHATRPLPPSSSVPAASHASHASHAVVAAAEARPARAEDEVDSGLGDISRTLQQLKQEKGGPSFDSGAEAELAAAELLGLKASAQPARPPPAWPPHSGSQPFARAQPTHAFPTPVPPLPAHPTHQVPCSTTTLYPPPYAHTAPPPFTSQPTLTTPSIFPNPLPSSVTPYAAPLSTSVPPYATPLTSSAPLFAAPPSWPPMQPPLMHPHSYTNPALLHQQQHALASNLAYPPTQQHALASNLAYPPTQQQQQQQPLQPLVGGADPVVKEVQHADGKLERFYASGKRLVAFGNGTRKLVLPPPLGSESLGRAASTTLIAFVNGDYKHQLPGGTTEYYYAEVGTWHLTQPDGVEVFYFPSGQAEAHHPSGLKEILFPDGAARHAMVDGLEHEVTLQQLSLAVRQPPPKPRWDSS